MKHVGSLFADIQEVDSILLEAKVVKETITNQIRLFLNGNPKSHLFAKFANLHPTLWGKYPDLTNKQIEEAISHQQVAQVETKYARFQNVANARIFTEADLESLATWDVLPPALKKTKIFRTETIDHRMVNFNSEPEWNTYVALKEKGYIQSFRAQSLEIRYATYLKTDKRYYPDFIFLTPEGYIAIVESKPSSIMNTFLVRCKYEALKHFCESRGFIYTMMDEHLTTLEMIKTEELPHEITQVFDLLFDEHRVFNEEMIHQVFDRFSEITQKEIREILGKYILQRDLVNKSSVGINIKKHKKINFNKIKANLLKGQTIVE